MWVLGQHSGLKVDMMAGGDRSKKDKEEGVFVSKETNKLAKHRTGN
jgi:hypothetical protein